MKEALPPEIYQTLVLGAITIIGAAVAYVVAVLSRMKREQDARAPLEEKRDVERAELLENVRRMANGSSVHLVTPTQRTVAPRRTPDRRAGPRRRSEQHAPPDAPPDAPRDPRGYDDRFDYGGPI